MIRLMLKDAEGVAVQEALAADPKYRELLAKVRDQIERARFEGRDDAEDDDEDGEYWQHAH